MNEYTLKAHKIAYALSKKLGIEICVRRLPLVNGHMAFEFVTDKYAWGFSQSFLDGNLAAFATRIMEGIARVSHGNKKGDARHKGERV